MPGHGTTLIAGLGTMGSASLRAIKAAGGGVRGFDRFRPPHAFAEHAGEQRMFRMSYHEHADYVPLLRRAFELWCALPVPSGEPAHFHVTGAVYLGEPAGELVSGATAAARLHELSHELLAHADVGARLPQFKVPGSFVGLAERDAGYIVPELAVARMLGAAGQGELHADEPVMSWRAGTSGCEVRTEHGVHAGDRLVIAAGPWAGKLVPELAGRLRVTRQVQVWVSPPEPERFALGRFPCWAVELPAGGLLYGFPIPPGRREMKIAIHRAGASADPDMVDRTIRHDDLAEVLGGIATYLPGAVAPVARASVCLYTNSPDGHFIIDRHPGHANVTVACGFSGHGFKFAPAIGEIVARLLRSDREPHPAPFLSLARFGQGEHS